jgi:hypothetical protein
VPQECALKDAAVDLQEGERATGAYPGGGSGRGCIPPRDGAKDQEARIRGPGRKPAQRPFA